MEKISQALAPSIKQRLLQVFDEKIKWIDFEIHDDGEFLLFLLETDLTDGSELIKEILSDASEIMDAQIQPRKGECAWMINICHRGALLDSNTGGAC